MTVMMIVKMIIDNGEYVLVQCWGLGIGILVGLMLRGFFKVDEASVLLEILKGNLQEPKLRWPCPLATKVKAVTARLVLHQLILQTDQRVCFYQVLGADAMTSSVLLNSSATTQNVYIYIIYTVTFTSALHQKQVNFFCVFFTKMPFWHPMFTILMILRTFVAKIRHCD